MLLKISLLVLFFAVMACLGTIAGKTDSKKRFFFFVGAGTLTIGIYFLVTYLLIKCYSIYIFSLIGATIFLCAYNCQRNTLKWWKSLLGLLACIIIKGLLFLSINFCIRECSSLYASLYVAIIFSKNNVQQT